MAELAERVDDALDEPVLQLSLGGVPVDGEKLERERILRDLLSELGVGAFEGVREVGRGCTLTEVKVGTQISREPREDLAAPRGCLLSLYWRLSDLPMHFGLRKIARTGVWEGCELRVPPPGPVRRASAARYVNVLHAPLTFVVRARMASIR